MTNKEDRIINGNDATRLLNDPLMVETMTAFRRSILEELATADPADMLQIHRLQAIISVIDNLREALAAFVIDANDISSEKQSPYT